MKSRKQMIPLKWGMDLNRVFSKKERKMVYKEL